MKVRKLSNRENEVLFMAARGLTNRDIGEELNLSDIYIGSILSSVYKKLGASNRAEAVAITMKQLSAV